MFRRILYSPFELGQLSWCSDCATGCMTEETLVKFLARVLEPKHVPFLHLCVKRPTVQLRDYALPRLPLPTVPLRKLEAV